MLYGLHLSAQGAQSQSTRLDVLANNLANAGTTGFKRRLAVFQDHQPYDVANGEQGVVPGNLNESTGGVTVAGIYTDRSSGPLKETGSSLDVALVGEGYLQVADPNGQKLLTRNGNLAVNSAGELVQSGSGYRLLAANGSPISLTGTGGSISIGETGEITQTVNGTASSIGRLAVMMPENEAAMKEMGQGLYQTDGAVTLAEEPHVKQGFLEMSGVQPTTELLSLIEASRTFETNINMMKFQDEALSRLLQSMPNR